MSALHSKPLIIQTASGEINLVIPAMIAYLIGYVLMQVGPTNLIYDLLDFLINVCVLSAVL